MGEKTEGAPQETIADVVLGMREWGNGEGCFNDNPEGDPLPCVFYTKEAWDALCDRLVCAARPKFPELDITSIPNYGIVVVIPPETITTSQAMMLRDAIRCAKAQSLPDTKFVVLQHGTTIQALADEDLARLGLQHIPAA